MSKAMACWSPQVLDWTLDGPANPATPGAMTSSAGFFLGRSVPLPVLKNECYGAGAATDQATIFEK